LEREKGKRKKMTSSMTKLKSSMIEKGVIANEGEPPLIDGLYGTNGFYFQVRFSLSHFKRISIELAKKRTIRFERTCSN
jgi:hypothetical protein